MEDSRGYLRWEFARAVALLQLAADALAAAALVGEALAAAAFVDEDPAAASAADIVVDLRTVPVDLAIAAEAENTNKQCHRQVLPGQRKIPQPPDQREGRPQCMQPLICELSSSLDSTQ